MNSASLRAFRPHVRLPIRSPAPLVRCLATAPPRDPGPKQKGLPMLPRKKVTTTLDQTVIPQLSTDEIRSVYSQELFVFRCDVAATQTFSAMASYPTLRDLGVLTADDISNLCRQIHTQFRLSRVDPGVLTPIKQLIIDIKAGNIPGHPLASVHLISCLKEMEQFERANDFWNWLIDQDETHCDARVYGVAIENYAYQGVALHELEKMFTEALERYCETVDPKVARNTGKATRVMLLQGIITARILHGDWRAAYEGFDICVRLFPTLTPARIYELFIYERPVKEAYIVFLMACRAGTPPKPAVLTPLLKEVWTRHKDLKAMVRLVYAFVGANGKPFAPHLNSLIFAILGSLPSDTSKNCGAAFDRVFDATMSLIRDLISAFGKLQVYPSESTFNTIISVGGKLKRLDLVHGGMKALYEAGLSPNMVTYRTIVNAFGEMKNEAEFKEGWKDLRNAKEEMGIPWDIRDFIALVKAGANLGQSEFVREELEHNKLEMGYDMYRRANNKLTAEERRLAHGESPVFLPPNLNAPEIPTPTNPPPLTDPETLTCIRSEVDKLSSIFSSGRVYDFASSPAFSTTTTTSRTSPIPQKIVDIDSAPPDIIPPSELQRFYKTLTASVSKVDAGEDGLTRTATGYNVAELRFENWRSVNRLLFEAELYEQEVIERRLRMLRDEPGGDDGMKVAFMGEERAKRRIEELRKGVAGVREVRMKGEDGWRKEELRVRGMMGGEVKAGFMVEDRVVP